MTKDVLNSIITVLTDPSLFINQVETYEGQFEDISDFLIVPPSAFVSIDRCKTDERSHTQPDYDVSVYLVTNHIHGTDQATMLDLIDLVSDKLNRLPITGSGYSGRLFYSGFSSLGIFPGFCVYQLNFTANC